MTYTPNIRMKEGKAQVLCPWRRKWVRLTPEEEVRQTFLHYLTNEKHYPASRIAVEHPIRVGEMSKRCDAVVMDDKLQPVCIIEFKAKEVVITQHVFDQIAVYNRRLNVPYLIISNGKTTYICLTSGNELHFLKDIPEYDELWTR